jgi:hypothetical protein
MQMSDSVAETAGSGSITDAQRAWTMTFCGIDMTRDAGGAPNGPGGGASTEGSGAPGGPSSLSMRPRPSRLDQSRDDAVRKLAGESSDVSRQQVEDELKEFLEKLAKAQKTRSVKVTDKVLSVDRVLHDGMGADLPPLLKSGDSGDYEPADLARKLAGALPERIPAANLARFRALKPVELTPEGSMTDQIHRKYAEERDALVHRLPKSIQGLAVKAIDAAIEKGVPLAAEKIFGGLGAGSELEGIVKQFTDDWSKKVTGYDESHQF